MHSVCLAPWRLFRVIHWISCSWADVFVNAYANACFQHMMGSARHGGCGYLSGERGPGLQGLVAWRCALCRRPHARIYPPFGCQGLSPLVAVVIMAV